LYLSLNNKKEKVEQQSIFHYQEEEGANETKIKTIIREQYA